MMKISDKCLIEKGRIIAVASDATEEEIAVIPSSFDMHNAIENFVQRVESGSFRPKFEYKTFKDLLTKIKAKNEQSSF